jgi:hypothetical protein
MTDAFVEFGGGKNKAGLDTKIYQFLPPKIAGLDQHLFWEILI